jgi:hypothetical protein
MEFRLGGKVYHFDSSVTDLCHTMFGWAKFRTAKGGIKLHLMLEHQVFLPVYANITVAKIHDDKAMQTLDPVVGLPRGSHLCVDRGYIVYAMFYSWNRRGINFVSRAWDDMSHGVVKECELPRPVGRPPADDNPKPRGRKPNSAEGKKPAENLKTRVLSDEIIEISSYKGHGNYPDHLRIVTAETVSGKGKRTKIRKMKFLTDNMTLSPTTICDPYKAGWRVESFFEMIRQELVVKSFLGASANAVKTRIYVALIALLLLRFIQASLDMPWSMGHMVPAIRQLLPMFRDIKLWPDRYSPNSPRNALVQPRSRGRPAKKFKPNPYAISLFEGLKVLSWAGCRSPAWDGPRFLDSRIVSTSKG